MKTSKTRVTVTLDPAVVRAGADAVADGTASSLSAWINAALADRVAHQRRVAGMSEAIAMYEAEFGKMTDEEVEAQWRADRRNAIRFGGRKTSGGKRRRRAA